MDKVRFFPSGSFSYSSRRETISMCDGIQNKEPWGHKKAVLAGLLERLPGRVRNRSTEPCEVERGEEGEGAGPAQGGRPLRQARSGSGASAKRMLSGALERGVT